CSGEQHAPGLADMARPGPRHRPARRFRHRPAVGRCDGPQWRHWSDIVDRHVRASEYGGDAQLRSGPGNINSVDLRMRGRRAHQHTMQVAGEGDVGDEASLPAQGFLIFWAANRGANNLVQQWGARSYWDSSRKRSRRSNATLSETMKRSASPPFAEWLASVQCGIENTSCRDQSNVCSPTVERPVPETTRQIMLQVVRFGRVA